MGRGRGKGKKPTVITSREDPGSGEDEKIPAYEGKERPQKALKDDVEEETEAEKIEEDGDNPNGSISIKDTKIVVGSANGRKRKRSTQAKDIIDTEKHDNKIDLKSSTNDSAKSVGFRQNGSRRKNKPCRAAEAGLGSEMGLKSFEARRDGRPGQAIVRARNICRSDPPVALRKDFDLIRSICPRSSLSSCVTEPTTR